MRTNQFARVLNHVTKEETAMPKQLDRVVFANGGGINWTWFAVIDVFTDGTARVVREGRLHRSDYSQGAAEETKYSEASRGYRYTINEASNDGDWSKPRIAESVSINDKVYPFADGPVGRWSFGGLLPL